METACGTDPQNATSVPGDVDGDGICDALDSDTDGDGVIDSQDETGVLLQKKGNPVATGRDFSFDEGGQLAICFDWWLWCLG